MRCAPQWIPNGGADGLKILHAIKHSLKTGHVTEARVAV